MSDILAIGLQAMQADAARMERVGLNLANTLTPGYKREVAMQRSGGVGAIDFATLLEQQAGVGPAGVSGIESARDMAVGTLRNTGQSLDLALTGPGFFEVSTPGGPAYTRHGQFQLDARGRVVTAQGHALMGSGGEIVLSSLPAIDAGGNVSEDGRIVARLRVVDFDDSASLPRIDGGLYAAGRNATTLADGAVQIRQGYLENANVDPMREMVNMIATMRHFESVHRAVQMYDDMLGTAIRRLGDA